MERDFSPVCILAQHFLIFHLITAKVILFCLFLKVFEATTNITEGLENKMTWYGFLDFKIDVLHSQIMQTMGK